MIFPQVKLTIPKQELTHILIGLAYGGILLGWLSTEENNITLVSILGAGLGSLLTGLSVLRWFGGRVLPLKIWLPSAFALGALGGLSWNLSAILLMIMKNVQHSHVTLDFSGEVIVAMAERIPFWMLAGALLGGAIGLLVLALYKP